jgi:xylulokinase
MNPSEAFDNLKKLETIVPDDEKDSIWEHYGDWKEQLYKLLK